MKIKTERDFYDTFAGHIEWKGQTAYILASDAESFLDHIVKADAGLLGIDGALLEGRMISEPVEAILDMSDSPKSYEDARKFIREQQGRLTHFSFVVEDKSGTTSEQSGGEVRG